MAVIVLLRSSTLRRTKQLIVYPEREGIVLQAIESGMTHAAAASKYQCTRGRIQTILRHARKRQEHAARLRALGFVVTEIVK